MGHADQRWLLGRGVVRRRCQLLGRDGGAKDSDDGRRRRRQRQRAATGGTFTGGTGTGGGVSCAVGQLSCSGVCTTVASDLRHCGTCNNACGNGPELHRRPVHVHCGPDRVRRGVRQHDGGPAELRRVWKRLHREGSSVRRECARRRAPRACSMRPELHQRDDRPDELRLLYERVRRRSGMRQRRVRLPTGLTTCSGACVNTQSDPANCGVCGTRCGAGQSCTAGVCTGGGMGGAGPAVAAASVRAAAGGAGVTGGSVGGSGGGSTRPGGCAIAPGMIADFEEGGTAPVVIGQEGRNGEWEKFGDKASRNQVMTVAASGNTAACATRTLSTSPARATRATWALVSASPGRRPRPWSTTRPAPIHGHSLQGQARHGRACDLAGALQHFDAVDRERAQTRADSARRAPRRRPRPRWIVTSTRVGSSRPVRALPTSRRAGRRSRTASIAISIRCRSPRTSRPSSATTSRPAC